ncbi:MAG: hypothetical protein JWO91_2901 [Acidobacteriaceae bacterium]|jgi:hypothetical protein|nr:hypothetical protein [Acidobacteriaceae bacterium]
MGASWRKYAGYLVLGIGFSFSVALGADKPHTFTGEVSDAMCGAHHMMEGSKTECTHACVGKGSKYAFVVGEKVYTLDTTDKKVLDDLYKLAGEKATISGTADDDTIKVSSVWPSK